MPKNMNIKKAASALNQNQKQIKAALAGGNMTFAAVEKSLGRAQFLLKLTGHKTATGEPRGLFSAGTMRIAPGQIVIVEGSEKLGFEIVARIDDLSDAQKLVKLGVMPPDVLSIAAVCGSVSGVAPEAEDDLFERAPISEGAPSFESRLAKGGVKGARRQQESLAAAAALASRLGSSFFSGGAKAVHVESAMDLSAFVGCDEEAVKKASGGGVKAARALASHEKGAVKSKEVVIEFALWQGQANDEDVAFKPVALAPAPFSWEDDDAVAIDIDAI